MWGKPNRFRPNAAAEPERAASGDASRAVAMIEVDVERQDGHIVAVRIGDSVLAYDGATEAVQVEGVWMRLTQVEGRYVLVPVVESTG